MSPPHRAVHLSVIAPAHNEEENVPPLVDEIEEALSPLGIDYEIIIVDDGSTDSTLRRLRSMLLDHPRLRILSLNPARFTLPNGQSAAMCAGIRASRGDLIATLDADLQNDPADIPALLDRLRETGADVIQGDRSGVRKDHVVRRAGSLISRWSRRLLLGDSIRDTGCSLRVMRREVALQLPLQFRGQHRFIPMTARYLGYNVVEMPVNHRPRTAGRTHYGILNRAPQGLIDCFAVRWMRKRRRPVQYEEIERSARAAIGASAPVQNQSKQRVTT